MTGRGADGASLILRVTTGLIFLFSGLQKLVPGTDATVAYFRDLGLPWPELMGPAMGALELFGGFALLVGFLTRMVGGLFVAEMLVALLVARLAGATAVHSVADAITLVRVELLLIASCSCLVLIGGGRWSVDAILRRRGGTASAQDPP
ncbi:MAG TPA: DoxX family protein [Candidatus Saccharimonadales bacterium]|nr:DoxX family protein [Candidatus Saccharimonadales bacterium]